MRSPKIFLRDNMGSMAHQTNFITPNLHLLVNQFYWGHKYLPPEPDSLGIQLNDHAENDSTAVMH